MPIDRDARSINYGTLINTIKYYVATKKNEADVSILMPKGIQDIVGGRGRRRQVIKQIYTG